MINNKLGRVVGTLHAAAFVLLAVLCCRNAYAIAPTVNDAESVVAEYHDTVITSRSTIQELAALSMRIDRDRKSGKDILLPTISQEEMALAKLRTPPPGLPDDVVPLAIVVDGTHLRNSLSVAWQADTGGQHRTLRWHVLPDPKYPRKFSWLVTTRFHDISVGTVKLVMVYMIKQTEGFFVGQKIGVEPRLGIRDFQGCFRIANGIPYAQDANKGMDVTAMAHPGSGYHGWCYRYRPVPGWSDIRLHYFAASSAPTWKAVADWIGRAYTGAAGRPSTSLAPIVADLQLNSSTLTAKQKIRVIQTWMATHLKYSTAHSKYYVPNDFDATVRNGGGDCKDLAFVMLVLLRAAHIDAHPAMTSMDDWWAFLQNSSNVEALDHIVVYLPDSGRYLDPTTANAEDAAYLAGRQVLDVGTAKVLNVPNVPME